MPRLPMFAFMKAKRITIITAAVTTAAAAIATAPAAMATTQTGAARTGVASVSPQAEPAFTCPVDKGYLCVHVRDTSGHYHWDKFYHCGTYGLGTEEATWYINNQTPGTEATFYYTNGVEWHTPPAKSGGGVKGPVLYVPFGTANVVKPC